MGSLYSGNRAGERASFAISAQLKAQARATASDAGMTFSDWVLEAVKDKLTPEVEARRLVMLLASLLEEYTRPNAISLASRTPTVVKTLAEAEAWLVK